MRNYGRGMWRRVADYERVRLPMIQQQEKQEYLEKYLNEMKINNYKKLFIERKKDLGALNLDKSTSSHNISLSEINRDHNTSRRIEYIEETESDDIDTITSITSENLSHHNLNNNDVENYENNVLSPQHNETITESPIEAPNVAINDATIYEKNNITENKKIRTKRKPKK